MCMSQEAGDGVTDHSEVIKALGRVVLGHRTLNGRAQLRDTHHADIPLTGKVVEESLMLRGRGGSPQRRLDHNDGPTAGTRL